MAFLGWFDGELRPDGWFDAELQPAGWFDTEAINTTTGGAVDGTAFLVGVQATSAVGSIVANGGAVNGTATLVGVSATAGVGALVGKGDANKTLTGVSASTGVGALSGKGDANKVLTGAAASSGIGVLVGKGNAATTLTGASATSGVGTITATGGAGAVDGTAFLTGASAVRGVGVIDASSGAVAGFSQEVTLRKWYVKRGKRILIFASANDADAFIDSEQEAKEAIEQAQKTSRRARKRFAAKVYTVKPVEEVDIGPLSGMAQHFGMAVDLPALYAQQNYARVLEIYAQAMLLQDEEDVELLLLA